MFLSNSSSRQVKLDPSMEVRRAFSCRRRLTVRILLLQRGLHDIEDELVFTNHDGYVFHDSRGFEAGAEEELKIVQDFVRRKSQEELLKDKLHAIWFVPSIICNCKVTRLLFRYCIPMDKDRPSLDLKYFDDICPDKNGMSKLYAL
jgi:hypothetical protein